ncbi:NACHT domain-containing protein [Streptomyces sp. TLI_146]|uniref:NACHT domain-containing protein n=1 Tax=Streptomyces sp. TLI_146 TaxID=1938858 RepID=UPI00214BDCDA|nr:NACHT domain-containing protein [Streptomyces sp. TLI_146]
MLAPFLDQPIPKAKVGDIDPLGAAIGLLALVVSIWAGWLSVRTLRWQETDVTTAAALLARAVLVAESDARRQLLGAHDKTIDVEFDFRPAAAHDAMGAALLGRLAEVVAYYRQLRPRRMVITGAPGAGKTVLAVELILGLLEDRAPEDPVPVRLSAAAWDTDQPVEAWLSTRLSEVYRVPPATATALVAAHRVLPVVDGLDEMDDGPALVYASRAGRALRALNAYQHGRGKAELVLTCRSDQYQALEAMRIWVQDAAHVEIRPVSAVKARDFLNRRVSELTRWRPVLHELGHHPSGLLAQSLSTPWRLTLAVTIYEQRDPRTGIYVHNLEDLLAPDLNALEAIRDHLLRLFIPAATALHPRPKGASYTPDQVHAWLAVLAGYLDNNIATGRSAAGRPLPSTDVVLHELWPLAGLRRPRLVHAAMIVGAWSMGAAAIAAHAATSSTSVYLLILTVSIWALAAFWPAFVAWQGVWPEATRADLYRLRTRSGARHLSSGLPVGLAGGSVAGIGVELAAGVPAGVSVGVMTALAAGLAAGLAAPGRIEAGDPRDMVRDDLAFGLGFGCAAALAAGLTGGLAGLTGGIAMALAGAFLGGVAGRRLGKTTSGVMFGLTGGGAVTFLGTLTTEHAGLLTGVLTAWLIGGLAIGIGGGPVLGITGGLAGTRYIALLLCTRRWNDQWLPWRLGQFLNWCYEAALIRVAGGGYQFRHRELQDYLARNPIP